MGTGRRCRVLVTGGAGFTGRRVVTALPEPGADVTHGVGSAYSASYGIVACSPRFSNVYGTGMAEEDIFVPCLMRAVRDGQGMQVYGDGTRARDLVRVGDPSGEAKGKAAK